MIKSMSDRLGTLIIANVLAASTTAGMSAIGMWISIIVSPGETGLGNALGGGLLFGLLAALYGFIISFPVYLVGLIVVGIPTWWILHNSGRTSVGAFSITAAIESVIAGAIVFRLLAPGTELAAPLLAIPGGLAGWIIWRRSYRPLTPPPAPPS
ncbi:MULTISPECIES: hypothetical protein [Brevundimonas]|jgi:hypothetical protein|uniref:Uncharacterized protein n=1 Tax=Brevundimonas aurantiaca TaxID=74316 RepID=A0A7W9FAW9_9CAUL|nr:MULTISPECIES: hypothetical protein [Brevundimonas]ALJ07695.1 hypothetical protein JL11_04565 [Brevundimonas sp. DS20]MAL56162.1 hypothetical protein [Brevundimonas sp.]MBB1177970.1 hypothetical protein [Pseudomonas sp. FW305-3-2-15-E-TSA4]MBB5740848.1 hypothetical protein [Brevundimonas aurantiaca]